MKDSYAVITGASAGIGVCFAKRLAKEGYPLVLVARREERLVKLAEKLNKEYGTECKVVVCDVSKTEECTRLMEEMKDIPVEVFINNAGFGDCGQFIKGDLSKELNMIDVNIKALHVLMKLALQKIENSQAELDCCKRQGYILNVASSAGLLPAGPYMATYYATKAYVTSLTQAVAEELREAGSGIYVGCLCPGPVDTEFNRVANVEFALKGISSEYCANYGINQMFRKKTVIIPTWFLKVALTFGRMIPRKLCISIAARQQKKKLYGAGK